MAMILMIDTLADRYKMLPSEVMDRGTTFDLYIMDAAISYHNHQARKDAGKPPELTQEEMLEMIKKVK